jgi:chloramphenicol O-acetyltransferase type A
MGEFIDLTRWKRRQHFELYRKTAQPFFSVTVEVDVTAAYDSSRVDQATSFFVTLAYSMMRAAHDTPAFRLRVRDGKVFSHDALRLSTTVLRDDETFSFAVFDPAPMLAAFAAQADRELARAKRPGPLTIPEGDDIIYHSTLPWLRFASFTNAINTGADSIPRIVFGKRVRDGARFTMPVAVEVHHAVVDGVDVAKFIERFEAGLKASE